MTGASFRRMHICTNCGERPHRLGSDLCTECATEHTKR